MFLLLKKHENFTVTLSLSVSASQAKLAAIWLQFHISWPGRDDFLESCLVKKYYQHKTPFKNTQFVARAFQSLCFDLVFFTVAGKRK